MKKIMSVIVGIIILVGVFKVLNFMEQREYQNAISRCGNEKNVVLRHTNQGDRYYSCKVEK